MATNVTEKDKTLNDVIEWCGDCLLYTSDAADE